MSNKRTPKPATTKLQTFTCASCGQRMTQVYSYYCSRPICSQRCRDSYVDWLRKQTAAQRR